MPPSTRDPELRRRSWLLAALAFVGLILVPLLGWLLVPAPPKISLAPVSAATDTGAVSPRPSPPAFTAPASHPTAQVTATAATGPVRGRVLGPDHQPAGRAFIGCTEKDVSTTTDQDGTFELPLTADGCLATAHKPGFGSSEKVKLRAGDDRSNTLELRAGGRIEGVVVDEQGAAVTKFMIAVERFIGVDGDDDGPNGRPRTVENDKGQFAMEGVTPGKYVLVASAEGRPPARTDMLEVEPGRSLTGVRIVLARGAVISGIVTDAETKKPVSGAKVDLDSVTSSGVSAPPSVKTDDKGAYTLEGAPPSGPFSIRVAKDGYRTRIVSGLVARGGSGTADVQIQPKGAGTTGDSELGGIGAILGPPPDGLGAVILATTKDSPAERGGLQKADRIVRIDGTSADGLTLTDCIQRLRGEPGTRVTIWVKRGDQEIQANLTRAMVVR